MQGISGKLQGGGEMISVTEDSRGNFYAYLRSGQGTIRGEFGCLNMVARNGTLIRNAGRTMTYQLYNQRSRGTIAYPLRSSGESACILAALTGKFEGAGELVSLLSAENAMQMLLISSMQKDVAARVTCYRYRQ